jgi:hypothetical protein
VYQLSLNYPTRLQVAHQNHCPVPSMHPLPPALVLPPLGRLNYPRCYASVDNPPDVAHIRHGNSIPNQSVGHSSLRLDTRDCLVVSFTKEPLPETNQIVAIPKAPHHQLSLDTSTYTRNRSKTPLLAAHARSSPSVALVLVLPFPFRMPIRTRPPRLLGIKYI